MGFLSDLFGAPKPVPSVVIKNVLGEVLLEIPDAVIWLGQISKILTSPTPTFPTSPFGGPSAMG